MGYTRWEVRWIVYAAKQNEISAPSSVKHHFANILKKKKSEENHQIEFMRWNGRINVIIHFLSKRLYRENSIEYEIRVLTSFE